MEPNGPNTVRQTLKQPYLEAGTHMEAKYPEPWLSFGQEAWGNPLAQYINRYISKYKYEHSVICMHICPPKQKYTNKKNI